MPTVPSGEGWFTWNDVDCRDYGIYVLTQPTFIRPAERLSSVTIPGKSGSLTLREGPDVYDDISLSCMCVIDKPDELVTIPSALGYPHEISRIRAISGWLKGGGTVKFANRSDGFYYANIANQISFDRVLRDNPHKVFSVQFQCSPFFYLDAGQQPIYIRSPYYTPQSGDPQIDWVGAAIIDNLGTVYSDPLINVYGKREELGDADTIVDIYVDSIRGSGASQVQELVTHTYVSFVGAPHAYTYVRLDSDQKVAYADAPAGSQNRYRLMGSLVSGDFPMFPTGTIRIALDDSASHPARYLKVTPRWRCL